MAILHKPTARSVSAVIFNQNKDQILLIKRRDVPIWVLPGGGVDDGEAPEAAVIREAKEETGLEVAITRLVAVYTPINRLSNNSFLFECTSLSGSLTTTDETRQIGFFPLNALPSPFFFIHNDWLQETLQQHLEIIRKPLSQATYFGLLTYLCRHPIQTIRFILSRLGMPINS